MNQTEAIKIFLSQMTHSDLASLYTPDMECQVNVGQDGGDRITGEYIGRLWTGWTDGSTTWKSFRIPRNANTEPEYEDKPMSFTIEHAEAIGMTGWDWKKRCSRWIAFDFDAISGHKEQHTKKLTEQELLKVQESATMIPWITVRKSASGKGLHLYVFLDPVIPTKNHNEHAALARAILSKMSALAGFDFENKVDVCGQNMWVYHRKMKKIDIEGLPANGLSLVKQGISLDNVPIQWTDHIKVVKGHRSKNLPRFLEQVEGQTDAERTFLELMGQVSRTPLDEDHKKLIHWLEEKKTQSWWDTDHHILISHTHFLKEAHETLQLRGIFKTLSEGTEAPNDHNCFLHPIRNGAWVVRRYSMGCAEHASWDQDGRGYTRCFYNREPDFATAARTRDGVEVPSGGFIFSTAKSAATVARTLGAVIPNLPDALHNMRSILKKHSDGRLIMEIESDPNLVAAKDMQGWAVEKNKWKRIFNVTVSPASEIETPSYDDLVRHIITEAGEEFGWVLKSGDNEWHKKDLTHIERVLKSLNMPQKEVIGVVGSSIQRCWKLVSRPFQPEYIGDRLWNLNAAQLRFIPSQEDVKNYPTWTKVLNHCGKGLNEALQSHPWARANGVISGAEYLKIWVASLIKAPIEPLPYLFFYGEQDAGKSIFHEAISVLFTKGYQRADVALINPQGFNHELERAVLCVVEEINLRKNQQAANRIKDWVTARQLPIHRKGKTPYHVTNTTHWVQAANESSACPTFPGDTRITMMFVDTLNPNEKIPKPVLLDKLEKEAPDFLGSLISLEIPPSNDRLNVPMIATAEKLEVESSNRTPLQTFLDEKCYYSPGAMISVSELHSTFMLHIDPMESSHWGKQTMGANLPPRFPKGRSRSNGHFYVGNISFTQPTENDLKQTRLVASKDTKGQTFLDPETKGIQCG